MSNTNKYTPLIRAIVKGRALTDAEKDLLLTTLTPYHDKFQDTGVVCQACSSALSGYDAVGQAISSEIKRLMDANRMARDIYHRSPPKGGPRSAKVFEWPKGVNKAYVVEEFTFTSSSNGAAVVPVVFSERTRGEGDKFVHDVTLFSYGITALLTDKAALLGRETLYQEIKEGISKIIQHTVLLEETLLNGLKEDCSIFISTYKPMYSRVIDTYNAGTPYQGWYIHSAQALIAFPKSTLGLKE